MRETATSVCLLIINRIPQLPEIVIKSILANFKGRLYIGYLDFADVKDLNSLSDQIVCVDLFEEAERLGITSHVSGYRDYLEEDFFKLVQLKWSLFETLLRDDTNEFLIYSDVDVVWTKPAAQEITQGFVANPSCHLFVQDVSRQVVTTDLCMGFVGIRNSEISQNIIHASRIKHAEMLLSNLKTGDDAVITEIFKESTYRDNISPLPQVSFPAGYLINYFCKRTIFVGVAAERPYIFHANYVVGLHKKMLLLYVFLNQFGLAKEYFSLFFRIRARLEQYLRKIKFNFQIAIKNLG
ncbi:MAG: hypothetical protein RLZ10_1945 [Bacteroidota bacterium]